MKLFLFLCLLGIGLASTYQIRIGTKCKNSFDCSSGRAPCCRDANGKAIVEQEGRFEIIGERNGTCSTRLGAEGDECDSSCGCKKGYACYRPMSGFCCPPMLCYNATWVEEQKRYWENCHPPTCFFPP